MGTLHDLERCVPQAGPAAHLPRVNSGVVVEPVVTRLDAESLPAFADGLDLVVDGTDDFPTRFADLSAPEQTSLAGPAA